MKKIVLIIIIILIPMILLLNLKSRNLDIEISELDLSKIDNLMIVAHPDDEMLWGGAHLIKDNYLVVCITCGTNNKRVEEIKKVLQETDDELLMLGYPDKVFGKRSDWKNEKDKIFQDLKKIVELKKWNLIVTHNAEGEYGHNHHILTHEITKKVYNDLGLDTDLYFFGKYYSKKKMSKLLELPEEIKEEYYNKKVELLKLYKTQEETIKKFDHMIKYEEWVKEG